MAAKGGSADPTPRSADAPPRSADLANRAHGLWARSYGGGEWREGVSLHFSGAKTPRGHLYKEGYPPTLRHTPRSSLSHSLVSHLVSGAVGVRRRSGVGSRFRSRSSIVSPEDSV